MRLRAWPLLLVSLVLLGAAPESPAALHPQQLRSLDILHSSLHQSPLQIAVTTDDQSYRLGEPVAIRVMACNPSDEAYSEQRSCDTCWGDNGCFCCERLSITDANGEEVAFLLDPPVWCPGSGITLDLAPGACQAATMLTWPQCTGGCFPFAGGEDQVAPGTYTVRMRWNGDGPVIESAPFQILAQPYQAPVPASSAISSLLLMLLIAAAGAILHYR